MKATAYFLTLALVTLPIMQTRAQTPKTPATVSVANLATPTADTNKASAPQPTTTQPRNTVKTIVLDREIFQYTATARRDPFVSLLASGELRPLLSDLRLTTVAYDPNGRNSVAVLRDLETKQQYRVNRGAQLGRMRVVRIDQKSVTFVIEEYGFSRQEILTMSDTSTTSTR